MIEDVQSKAVCNIRKRAFGSVHGLKMLNRNKAQANKAGTSGILAGKWMGGFAISQKKEHL